MKGLQRALIVVALIAGPGLGIAVADDEHGKSDRKNQSDWDRKGRHDFPSASGYATWPRSKDECKDGGWRNYPQGFKNQGQCVSAVNRAERGDHRR